MSAKPRITELRNELTTNIDIVHPSDALKLFDHCDAQLFHGYDIYKSLYDEKIIHEIIRLSKLFENVIKDQTGTKKMVFGGCGTSGRFGWMFSRLFNRFLKTEKFGYTIAGYDPALIQSQEAYEDDCHLGFAEVEKFGQDLSAYVGISCGMSAPFVAGQLHYCLKKSINCCAIGFNPVPLARKKKLWENGSFYDELMRMNEANEIVLNPIYGPECIQGSSRMKGGSMTKILIDACFALGLKSCEISDEEEKERILYFEALRILQKFEATYRYFYSQNQSSLSSLIEKCGAVLSNGGNVYYIGQDESGILGIIDSSECEPTFGTKEFRGFVVGGWDVMKNNSVEKMKEKAKENERFEISTDYFLTHVLPKTSPEKDVIVFLGLGCEKDHDDKLQEVYERTTKHLVRHDNIYGIYISEQNSEKEDLVMKKIQKSGNLIHYRIPKLCIDVSGNPLASYGSFCMKLALNAVSTISHVLRGVTVSNIMINLKLSNSKLLVRGTRIISKMCEVEERKALRAIIRVVYDIDDDDDDEKVERIIKEEIEDSKNNERGIILKAAKCEKVITKAMLLVAGKCKTVEGTNELVSKGKFLRKLISEMIMK